MKKTFTMLMGLGLCACTYGGPDSSPDGWPPGTIEHPQGVYYVPVGRDNQGCQRYQKKVPGKMTAQVIQYRRKDGSFTANKEDAACLPR
ncbi:hypothetical protein [Luteithermobacter gelatinilyticus]|uniref:hypothetical protein n=1 Tax=Luteithermobacter gelatinilyticus TaxID=2582913 RepID=UPI001106D127|nr:hypothetical protein [Luteithermobacter gelatinilyticus]|tara:strand:- start:23829 stop:24095 length:267 start_codon:yes stop_codon:yes gene_type:complete